MQLKLGDTAPNFSGVSDGGQQFSLAGEIGKTNIVLYFYPKDFTPGCTKEACTFRDNWERVTSHGATIIGVSSDSPDTHAKFRKDHSLPFTLISDKDHAIRKLYGVDGRFIPPRTTFVIDKQGKIRDIFTSQTNISKHIDEAISTLDKISSEATA